MTKQQLINRFSELDVFASKAEASRTYNALFNIITEELSAGNEVVLGQSFGKFIIAQQAAKSGVVPGKPDQTYQSPAKSVVKFKPSAALKATVA